MVAELTATGCKPKFRSVTNALEVRGPNTCAETDSKPVLECLNES